MRISESRVQCSQCEYSTHWEKCAFMYLIDLQMIYDFITEPTICWQYVLDVLSSFNYVEISIMFMKWCMNESVIWRVWLPAVVGI
jgi:hypothetical protein